MFICLKKGETISSLLNPTASRSTSASALRRLLSFSGFTFSVPLLSTPTLSFSVFLFTEERYSNILLARSFTVDKGVLS